MSAKQFYNQSHVPRTIYNQQHHTTSCILCASFFLADQTYNRKQFSNNMMFSFNVSLFVILESDFEYDDHILLVKPLNLFFRGFSTVFGSPLLFRLHIF